MQAQKIGIWEDEDDDLNKIFKQCSEKGESRGGLNIGNHLVVESKKSF